MKFNRNSGFTLIELIVVIALAAVIVSSVLLNTSLINPNQRVENLTHKVAKLIYFVHQQALLKQKNYALSVTKKGYLFLLHNGEEWVPSKEKLLKEKKFPSDIESRLIIENTSVQTLEKDQLIPHLLILASGEMTPFEWVLKDEESAVSYKISGSYNGHVSTELSEDF